MFSSLKTSEQFCRKGVTGMMRTLSLAMMALHSDPAECPQVPASLA
jgi:hypothetical protein